MTKMLIDSSFADAEMIGYLLITQAIRESQIHHTAARLCEVI